MLSFLDNLNIDQLHRFHSISQISIAVLTGLTAVAIFFALVLTNKISGIEKKEKETLLQNWKENEASLDDTKKQLSEANEKIRINELALKKERELKKPREIDKAFISSLKSAVKKRPQGKIELLTIVGDKEAREFSGKLKAILEKIGWEIEAKNAMFIGGGEEGIEIKIKNDKLSDLPDYIQELLDFIKQIDPEHNVSFEKDLPAKTMKLQIGHKRKN